MRKDPFMLMFFIVLIAQIVISNFADFSVYLQITVIPSMIMMLPPSISTRKSLFIAFFTALFVDLATEGIVGMNTVAAVPVALLRMPVITMLLGEDPEGRGKFITMSGTGFLQVTLLILVSTSLYLAIYVWADGAGAAFSIIKFFVSLVASTFCSIGACGLLTSGQRR